MRLKWELGAGVKEPKDRSFEAVSEAVSSAAKKETVVASLFLSRKKKGGGGGGGGEGGGAEKPEQSCLLTSAQQGVWRPQACHPGRSCEPSGSCKQYYFLCEEVAKHCPRGPKPSSGSYLPLAVQAVRTLGS